jgi:hypothetical protein
MIIPLYRIDNSLDFSGAATTMAAALIACCAGLIGFPPFAGWVTA